MTTIREVKDLLRRYENIIEAINVCEDLRRKIENAISKLRRTQWV